MSSRLYSAESALSSDLKRSRRQDSFLPGERNISDLILEEMNPDPFPRLLSLGNWQDLIGHFFQRLPSALMVLCEPDWELYLRAHETFLDKINGGQLELHHGQVQSIPHPHHYFHGILGVDPWLNRKERQSGLIRAAALLRNGAKLVIAFRLDSKENHGLGFSFESLREDLIQSGLQKLQYSYSELESGSWVLASAIRE
jgi:hypothetical protein